MAKKKDNAPVVDPTAALDPALEGAIASEADLFSNGDGVDSIPAPQGLVDLFVEYGSAPEASKVAPAEEAYPVSEVYAITIEDDGSVSANAALVAFPVDPYGSATELRTALMRTVGNINGKQDKLDVFLATVAVGVKHALARFRSQVETNARHSEWLQDQEVKRNANRHQVGWQA